MTNKQTTYSLQNTFVDICNVSISVPLHKSWMCSFPPPAQLPWRRTPSSPAEYWHHGIRWRGPSGPRWLWLPPGTPMPTAYLSAIDSSGFNLLMVDTDKPGWGWLRFSLTSKCLEASSLRDISISLVRMLRKCMSLSSVARFTVAPFVDWRGPLWVGVSAKLTSQRSFSACSTDQDDELMVWGIVGNAVRSDSLPQVLVNVVIWTAVNTKKQALILQQRFNF